MPPAKLGWGCVTAILVSVAGTVSLANMAACGGDSKKAAPAPAPKVRDQVEQESEELIPAETFDQIQRTFARKAKTVAPCFPKALQAGEVNEDETVAVNVGLVIRPDGSPSKVEILARSKESKTLESCVVAAVKRWEFPSVPRPLQYSHGFKLQRF